jgi:hypothetical protein
MKLSYIGFSYLFLNIRTVAGTCYFPNGETVNDTPCNPASANSTCCGPGYACLSNHVCSLTEHTPTDISKTSPMYVRASCSDKSWTSPDCPSFCMNSTNGDNVGVGGMGIGKCDETGKFDRYYCRNNLTSEVNSELVLCANSTYYFEFTGQNPRSDISWSIILTSLIGFPSTLTIIGYQPTSSPSSTGSSLSSPQQSTVTSMESSPSTSTTFPASVSSNDEKERQKLLGLYLGLGLGVGIPLIVTLAGFFLYCRLGFNSKCVNTTILPILARKSVTPPNLHEADSGSTIHEVESYSIHELPSPYGVPLGSDTEESKFRQVCQEQDGRRI